MWVRVWVCEYVRVWVCDAEVWNVLNVCGEGESINAYMQWRRKYIMIGPARLRTRNYV